MMVTFQRESWRDIFEEIQPFLPIHYKELAVDQNDVPLDPNWQFYNDQCDSGVLICFTARDEGKLIGYNLSFVRGHIHYQSTLTAHNDIYYLSKAYRKHGNGRNFFSAWMVELKRMGVVRVLLGTKLHEDHRQLFKHLGFQEADTILTKVL